MRQFYCIAKTLICFSRAALVQQEQLALETSQLGFVISATGAYDFESAINCFKSFSPTAVS